MSVVVKFISTTQELILPDGTKITVRLKKNSKSNFSIKIVSPKEIGEIKVRKILQEDNHDGE